MGQDGFAVFDAQNVVGLAYQIPGATQLFQGGLTGGREGFSCVQVLPEQGREVLAQQHLSCLDKGLGILGFRAEAQVVTELA